ncbi:MAG: UvrD-helicase domain-containing protein, partial [Deltaproteobacteria bacterium]|nr:UvrD-helicase domain-containing protein [Deltaproteobacteria bacterium]
MPQALPFDLLHSPLEGTSLIEASAGTGKTYAVTGLFLRLIVEKGLHPGDILVVTFTQAATEELKQRIRGMLRQAVEAFSSSRAQDGFLKGLVTGSKDPEAALKALKQALRAFDETAICTIHGFCKRVLHENAFESGALFDTALVADQEDMKREIVYDFWRMHFYRASRLFVNYVLKAGFYPDTFYSLLSNHVSRPYLRIIPQADMPDSSGRERRFLSSFREAALAWDSAR